jgi:purine-binding chemotaxis protein CheW
MQHAAYLTFGIDASAYAIPATSVVEIVRAVAVMPLPGSPPIVTGVIDYRGAILPVFDVARRFQQPSRPVRAAHRLIVARAGSRTVALHVDSVDRLIDLNPDAVEPAPATVDGSVPIAGLARTGDGMLVLQDLDRFLSEAESRQLDDALASG